MGSNVSKNVDGRSSAVGTLVGDSEDDDAGGGIRGIHPRNHHKKPSPSHTGGDRKKPSSQHTAVQNEPHRRKAVNTEKHCSPARRVMMPTQLRRDPLDDALVDSLANTTASSTAESAAAVLDNCLFRAAPNATAPAAAYVDAAQGKMAPQFSSARESLSKARASPMTIPTTAANASNTSRSHGDTPASSDSARSAGSLLSQSASDTSCSSVDSALTPPSTHPAFGSHLGDWPTAIGVYDFTEHGSAPVSDSEVSSSSSGAENHTWLNSLIRRICVAGIDPAGRQKNHSFELSGEEVKNIARMASSALLEEPTLLRIPAPVKIVGDLHGQFKDLLRILRTCGMPPDTTYLFLGDYVDRGKQSLETLLLLLCLKLRYPQHVHLLRGNHECANVTRVYGFYDECKRRLSVRSWRQLVDVFNSLPIAAIVGERIFCVHGGLSPSLNAFSDIEKISRPTDIPGKGLISDLLWSDPDLQVSEWADNDRGVSFCFGKRVLDRFCKNMGIDLVARGHMVVEDGYEFFGQRKLVTVFSAPNYCGDFDNWGAVMSVDDKLLCTFELIEPHGTLSNAKPAAKQPAKQPAKQTTAKQTA